MHAPAKLWIIMTQLMESTPSLDIWMPMVGWNHGGSIYKEAQNNKHSGPWQAKLRQKSEPWFVYLVSLYISFIELWVIHFWSFELKQLLILLFNFIAILIDKSKVLYSLCTFLLKSISIHFILHFYHIANNNSLEDWSKTLLK